MRVRLPPRAPPIKTIDYGESLFLLTFLERLAGHSRDTATKVRLKGYPQQIETFDRLTDARKWATQAEAAIRERRHFKTVEAQKHTEPRGRVRFLSDDERDRLLQACRESASRYLYQVVVLALSTGMRSGEITRMTWELVDLQRHRGLPIPRPSAFSRVLSGNERPVAG